MERIQYDSNMVLRTVYLPRELDDLLRKIAFEQHKSKNEIIRTLLQEALRERQDGFVEVARSVAAQV